MTYEQQKREYDTILSIDKILGRNRKTYEADLKKLEEKRKKKKDGMEDYKPTGYLTLSNHGGITIQISRDGEGVRYQWYDKEPSQKWLPIKYTSSGRAYFNALKRRWYLDEFMRLGLF